jgi:hypothetical protein
LKSRRAALAALVVLAAPAALPLSAQEARRVEPAGIPVRYAEGVAHGFLDLRTADGALLANGDLLQVPGDHGIESRMIFLFPDSSLFEETVSFTQHGVFALQSYHLVQRGPAFAADLDASLSANGHYVVKAKSHRDGKEKQYVGRLDLPPDVSNGLVVTLLKNLARHDTQTVHLVAFMPEPRLIRLELAPVGEQRVLNGQRAETAVEFDLKPRLGALVGLFARLLGKMPPDSHVWIVMHDVPAFVRVVGPLYTGPVWRIDLSSPHWPR